MRLAKLVGPGCAKDVIFSARKIVAEEELRRIQDELEKTRDRYFHLYDFAPVGYVTLTEKGIIDDANLTLLACLG